MSRRTAGWTSTVSSRCVAVKRVCHAGRLGGHLQSVPGVPLSKVCVTQDGWVDIYSQFQVCRCQKSVSRRTAGWTSTVSSRCVAVKSLCHAGRLGGHIQSVPGVSLSKVCVTQDGWVDIYSQFQVCRCQKYVSRRTAGWTSTVSTRCVAVESLCHAGRLGGHLQSVPGVSLSKVCVTQDGWVDIYSQFQVCRCQKSVSRRTAGWTSIVSSRCVAVKSLCHAGRLGGYLQSVPGVSLSKVCVTQDGWVDIYSQFQVCRCQKSVSRRTAGWTSIVSSRCVAVKSLCHAGRLGGHLQSVPGVSLSKVCVTKDGWVDIYRQFQVCRSQKSVSRRTAGWTSTVSSRCVAVKSLCHAGRLGGHLQSVPGVSLSKVCVTQDGWVDIYSQFQVCRCQKSVSRRTAGWTSTVSSRCVAVKSLCHAGRLGGHLQSVPGVSLSKVCVTQDGWVDIYSQFQVCRCQKSVAHRTAGWTSTVSSRCVAVESMFHAGRLGGHLQSVPDVSLSKVCVTQDGWVDIYSQFQVCRCQKSVARRTAGWTSTVSSRCVAVKSLWHAGRLGGHLQSVPGVSLLKFCVTQDGWVDIYSEFQVCRCQKSVSRRTAGWTSTVSSRCVTVKSLCHTGRLGGHLQSVPGV